MGLGAERRGRAVGSENRGQDGLVRLLGGGDGAADRCSDVGGPDRGGGDEQGDHRVDAGIGEDERQRPLEALGGGRAEHVDRVRERRLDGERRREGGTRLLGERRQLEPDRLARVCAEDPEPAGVRQHRHASPLRDGLRGEERGDVEQGGEGVGADHACLAEDGVDRGVGAGECGGVGAGGLLAGAGAAALHREHWLLPCETPRDARELARVAERLEIHQDEVGARVVLPPLEEVVRGDIGLVADRHEGGEPEPARLGALEEGKAERARCEEKPIRPAGNARGAKVAFIPTDALAIPRQFGPTSRAP